MTSGVRTIIYPTKDLAAATATFRALLASDPVVETPYYVQFTDADQAIGIDPNGHAAGLVGPTPHWHVDDIRSTFARLLEAGATEQQAVRDVGGGRLVASVLDVDGNPIGLLQDA
jgi:predicted enzyme related to lactoylglutathione lyase